MAKMLHVEQANREYTTNSLWWLNNLQEMFFLILSHLPINHIVKCRLVCHAWSSWALHDLVWSRHVERITSFYPFFKSEFVDVLPNQTVGPGRSVEYDVPAKRRKAGGKRKVASKKTQEMPKSGRWFAVKKFLNDRFAMEKAQIFQAVGDYDVKYEKRLLHNIGAAVPTIKFCWVGTTKKNVFKEFVLYVANEFHRGGGRNTRSIRITRHFMIRVNFADDTKSYIQLTSNLRNFILGCDETYISNSHLQIVHSRLLAIFNTTNNNIF